MKHRDRHQSRINNRVNHMPVYSERQPYYRQPPGDSMVNRAVGGSRVGLTGSSGISSRLGSLVSGSVSGGVSGSSGNAMAAGSGTVTLYTRTSEGQLVSSGIDVTVNNCFSSAVGGNEWVLITWDYFNNCYWLTSADCT